MGNSQDTYFPAKSSSCMRKYALSRYTYNSAEIQKAEFILIKIYDFIRHRIQLL